MNLLGKRALVNGGSRGIGAAIAIALAEHGADVAVTYQRSADRAATVVGSIEEKGRRGLAIQADSADPEAISRAVTETVDAFGGLDILVNSAGVGTAGMTADLSLVDLQAMLD
ncbi:MAG: SDR family NAD(P)-dependent oxidoreductase, partial [Mesorhizobium sp.]